MTGYLNPHGSSLGLYGQFISLSMSDDEEREWLGVESLAIFDPFDEEEIEHSRDMREGVDDYDFLDDNLEETFWSSLMLGSDYDWEFPEDNVATWIAERYAEVIQLNDKYGYRARPLADNDDDLHPLEQLPPQRLTWLEGEAKWFRKMRNAKAKRH